MKNRQMERNDDAVNNEQSSVYDVKDSVLTVLRIRRELWEIRRIQLRILVLAAILLSVLLTTVMTLVR